MVKCGFTKHNGVGIQNVKDVEVGGADQLDVGEVIGSTEQLRGFLGNNEQDVLTVKLEVVQLLGDFASLAGGREAGGVDGLGLVLEAEGLANRQFLGAPGKLLGEVFVAGATEGDTTVAPDWVAGGAKAGATSSLLLPGFLATAADFATL